MQLHHFKHQERTRDTHLFRRVSTPEGGFVAVEGTVYVNQEDIKDWSDAEYLEAMRVGSLLEAGEEVVFENPEAM